MLQLKRLKMNKLSFFFCLIKLQIENFTSITACDIIYKANEFGYSASQQARNPIPYPNNPQAT